MASADPTVFIVDDDPSVLKAVSRMVRTMQLNVVTYASPRKFIDDHDPTLHGCVVLDFSMPELNGLELQQAMVERGSGLPIIFLTGHGDIPMSVHAMKRGAVDFLTKPVDGDQLIEAVRRAIERDKSDRAARAAAAEIRQRVATLTPREHEVMIHVVAGQLNKQIAADLGTVEKTIKVHRARVMEKMKAQSLADLVRLAEHAKS